MTETLLARYEAWKGVPHRIGGTDHRGVDCSGLMQIVFREAFDMELPRTSREQSRLGQNVPPADMRPGDLVYFIDKRGDHIGVVVERGRFLHASATVGVTVSQFDAYWWPRLKRVQRVLPPSLTAAQSGF
ncbi:NlpC/P60 family protein [Desulfomicrobium escambiense]|uniref:NlpC/P60 family protein n=1 Tax=Desulfomicrobium escambiense TaxID=29503 RepID=UPI0004200225|nr:NlpC/P60 family protein [Desulfomicrobium escambiense]